MSFLYPMIFDGSKKIRKLKKSFTISQGNKERIMMLLDTEMEDIHDILEIMKGLGRKTGTVARVLTSKLSSIIFKSKT